jgi:hypothetical protein
MTAILSCLLAAVLTSPAPLDSPGSAPAVSPPAAATAALEALYGPPSTAGFGSAVFQVRGIADSNLELAALGIYRSFLGDKWTRRESDWRGGFRLLYDRPATGGAGIIAELNALTDPALRSVVELLVDNMEDPAAARAALTGAFDDPRVRQLHLYAVGDGEQYSGVEIAARHADGQATFLILLLD